MLFNLKNVSVFIKKKFKKNLGFDLFVFILRSQRSSHVLHCEELFTTYHAKKNKKNLIFTVDKDRWNFALEAARAFFLCSTIREATVKTSFVICI